MFLEDQVLFGKLNKSIFCCLIINDFCPILFLATEDNAKKIASGISVDKTEFSVSFNEYLSLMGSQNKMQEPSVDALLECFEIFDTNKNGRITEIVFRKIMSGKLGDEAFEVEEMLAEYKRIHVHNVPPTPDGEEYIDYKKFVAMLQK